MSPAVPPALLYVAGMVTGSAIALGVGYYAFLPEASPRTFLREFVRTDWRYLGVAWAVTYLVNELAVQFHAAKTFTWAVYRVEGTAVGAFQAVTVAPLTEFFTAVYLLALPFVVLFTYFKLKVHDEHEARRYALAYVLIVLLAVPFFLFTPVRIPSQYHPEIQPLLLESSPIVQAGITATDTLLKAFPSLHTGLAVLATVYARKTEPRYTAVVAVLSTLIVLSTLYLGVHWLSDVVFGVVLVGVAYALSRHVDPERVFRPTLDVGSPP